MKAVLVCLLTLLALQGSFAQSTDNVHALNLAPTHIPQSPDAASLGQYGSHPVSNYTGTPQIQIPLHTLQGRTLSWPIGLSYHASGLKVEQIASSVGAGWSLQGVGSISRQIRHLTDFGITGMTNGLVSGNHQLPVFVNTGNCNIGLEDGSISPSSVADLELKYLKNEYDMEPDHFYYNFGAYSGSFVFDRNKQALFNTPFFTSMVHPVMDSDGWTFITPDGFTYTFGTQADNCVEWTEYDLNLYGNPYSSPRNQATAWYLKEVESPDGERIVFEYQSYALNYTGVDYNSRTYSPNPNNYSTYSSNTISQNTVAIQGRLLSKVRLINNYREERIELSYTSGRNDVSGAMKLDRVDVFHKDLVHNADQLVKSFVLSYHNESNRLWLAAVQELGSNGSSGDRLPPHSFSYQQRSAFPNHRSYEQDYWGYYNGKAIPPGATSGHVPSKAYFQGQEYLFANGSDRSVDVHKMMYGLLSRIDYPTGGFTLFDYEPHTFNNAAYAGSQQGGGVRIKRTSTYDHAGSSQAMVKRYHYTVEQEGSPVSSGKLLWRPTHVMPVDLPDPSSNWAWGWATAPYLQFSSASLVSGGNSVGYDQVTVLHGENGENGKEVYQYINDEQVEHYLSTGYSHNGSPTYMTGVPGQGFDYRNGSLLKRTVYATNSGQYTAKSEQVNTYAEGNYSGGSTHVAYAHGLKLTCPMVATMGIADSKTMLSTGPPTQNPCNLLKFNYYGIAVRWPRLIEARERAWGDDGSLLETKTQFRYNNPAHEQMSESITTNSNGEVVKKTVTYPHDHSGLYYGTDMAALQTGNFRYLPISEKYEVDGQTVYSRIFAYDNLGHRTAVYDWNRNTYAYDLLADFSYDIHGRMTGYQPDRGTATAYRWHHAHHQPVAEVGNATLGETAYSSFEAPGGGGWAYPEAHTEAVYGSPSGSRAFRADQGAVTLTGLDASQRYSIAFFARGGGNEVWVDYQPGSGGPYEHQLPLTSDWKFYRITITGTTEVELHATAGNVVHLDELRMAPEEALFTTYVYNEQQQLVAILDENGQHLAFEYDDLGRLRLKRDAEGNILERNTYHYRNN